MRLTDVGAAGGDSEMDNHFAATRFSRLLFDLANEVVNDSTRYNLDSVCCNCVICNRPIRGSGYLTDGKSYYSKIYSGVGRRGDAQFGHIDEGENNSNRKQSGGHNQVDRYATGIGWSVGHQKLTRCPIGFRWLPALATTERPRSGVAKRCPISVQFARSSFLSAAFIEFSGHPQIHGQNGPSCEDVLRSHISL